MASDIGWHLYRTFLALLDEGSLSGAARALGITQPTAGRHIAALEQGLKVVLFTRSPQGLLPTQAALTLRSYAQSMGNTAQALERAASGQGCGVHGTVRLSVSQVMGVQVLPPILTQLREQHPGLNMELVLADDVHDVLRLEADIAVRNVRPQQEQLIARRTGQLELGLYAHHDYLRRCGTPNTPDALQHHAIIGYDQPSPFVRHLPPPWSDMGRDGFAWRTDSALAQMALLRSGAGIGVCQVLLAQREAALVRVLPQVFSLHLETFVVMHEDLRHVPRCRATFDALVQGLEHYMQQPLASTPPH